MDYSFISLILFVISTILYFAFLKPTLTAADLEKANGFTDYYSACNSKLMVYIAVVVCSQLFLNFFYLVSKCGGSPAQNIGAAIGYTFVPYLFIFGVLVGVLIIFPGFKSAFSNVIGYFCISSSANQLLSDLLVNTDVSDSTNGMTADEQSQMEKSATLIMKICGNKSLLINQLNPENFSTMWNDLLKPLVKKSLSPDILKDKKEELLKLVVTKDNIGEACWYIYAGVLVSSIVAYNLSTRGCVKTVEQIKKEHDDYIEKQEEIADEAKLKAQTIYS
ncbi:hypothetical protein N9K75_01280 [bacterium]|nr:hypothetical protein [bacterium]|tara:strand:- start:134 stop:964 length:831 start_codon:yes stop_codon:yes gene_type:complete